MVRREKKNFSRSKKFDEIQQDRKAKLQERNIQRKTGYERDLRILSKRLLEPLRSAEEGNEQLTRDDLLKLKQRVDKLITKSRVLENSKKVNLSKIRSALIAQRNLIVDYMHGKQHLAGLVKVKGEKPLPSGPVESSDNGKHPQPTQMEVKPEYQDLGFNAEASKKDDTSDKTSLFKNLGFDVGDKATQKSGDDFIVNPVPPPQPNKIERRPVPVEKEESPSAINRKIIITAIDDAISSVINLGIEHLMHYRRDRKSDDLSYRDEIVRFIDSEIKMAKRRAMHRLRTMGSNDLALREFGQLFDREFVLNKNEMVRKCLYMSRVLEYRKGSTSSG